MGLQQSLQTAVLRLCMPLRQSRRAQSSFQRLTQRMARDTRSRRMQQRHMSSGPRPYQSLHRCLTRAAGHLAVWTPPLMRAEAPWKIRHVH